MSQGGDEKEVSGITVSELYSHSKWGPGNVGIE